jgi:hypothetical protein
MADNGNGSNGGGISVQTIISAAVLVIMAFGSGWTIFEAQFSAVARQIEELKQINEFRLGEQGSHILSLERIVREDLQSVFIPRKEFDEFQKRFEALIVEINRLQADQHAAALTTARHPIDKETVDVIDAGFSKRIDQIEVQIQDINRQIAAALIIIDQNKTAVRSVLPPDK